jgi:hypothetical protein
MGRLFAQSKKANVMAGLPSANAAEIEIFKKIAQSPDDMPVFMLNLNKHRAAAHYPVGSLYTEYMAILATLLSHGCCRGARS